VINFYFRCKVIPLKQLVKIIEFIFHEIYGLIYEIAFFYEKL